MTIARCLSPVLMLLASAAPAAELRDFCADRPGKGTPPCILDIGHLQVETGIVDASLTRGHGQDNDSFSFAQTLLRFGVGRTTEVQLGWTPYLLSHDHGGGTTRGVGDVSVAVRQSLLRPDGGGVSVAVQPFVTVPTATNGFGAGDWTGGVLLPFAADLPGGFSLSATPEVDVLPNASRGGSHAAYVAVVGLAHKLGDVTAGVELWANHDADPDMASTQASFDVDLAWTPASAKNLQFDAGANLGLTRATPDVELYVGIAARF